MLNLNRLRKDEILWLANHHCRHGHRYIEHLNCVETEKPNMCPVFEKIGFLDIEASNLNADFGIIISYAIKELDGGVYKYVVSPRELKSGIYDKNLVTQCITDMRKFDRLVVYYGGDNRFDLPTLRTRAVYWGLDFPSYKEIKIFDLYPVIKRKFNLHRNRLETACDFFGIPSKNHRLKPDIWIKVMGGDKKALDYVLVHNIEDCLSTEALYLKVVKYSNISNTSI